MRTAPSLRMIPLGSGSSGNSTVITDGNTTLLVDCGFSCREVTRRMQAVGLDPANVDALLVTHEHSDHIRGIDVFCRRRALSALIYASEGTRCAARLDDTGAEVVSVRAGRATMIGTLEVVPFRTSHDSTEPLGFRIQRDGEAVGIATDTGVFSDEIAEGLAGCAVIALEANHDLEMLENGPYPIYLKRRILSERGHLSNADAATALERLASDGLRRVFAMHQSRINNTARLARSALAARLARMGLDVPVVVASQHEPSAAT